MPRPHKTTHAEVAEHYQHPYCAQKAAMTCSICRRRMPIPAQPPRCSQRHQREEPEEYSGYLQPQHAGESRERPPYCLAKPLASSPHALLRRARLRCCPGRRLSHLCGGRPRRNRRWSCLFLRGIFRRGSVHRRHQRLNRLPRSNPQRSSKANPIHDRSVASRLLSAKARGPRDQIPRRRIQAFRKHAYRSERGRTNHETLDLGRGWNVCCCCWFAGLGRGPNPEG
jgi:hypothetical protein